MQTVRLSHIQFIPTKTAAPCLELLYRANTPACLTKDGLVQLAANTHYDFSTYFNILSLAKWKQYTNTQNFALRLDICGSFTLQFFGVKENGSALLVPLGEATSQAFDSLTSTAFPIPETDAACVGFTLTTIEECFIENASYEAQAKPEDIHPVHLSVVMTTFNNEEYLIPNINLFNELLAENTSGEPNLSVHIVDNGKTIDPSKYENDNLFIHPNNNTGGAGGFTRGMIETLQNQPHATHVLLMDDDVSIFPESIRRTIALLRLRKPSYENLCISGAMLRMAEPHAFHEDVGYVRQTAGYTSLKPWMDLSSLKDVLKNESISTEAPNAYGAWWYCCIPVSLIKQYGLPLPLFIRCDDVEYGMRLKPTIATMNGICVWHAQFEGRFRASVDNYQYIRNFLILNTLHEVASEFFFMLRMKRVFRQEINSLAYNNVELMLDGFEDYLKGPDFIRQDLGAKLMKENGQRNEKLIPVAQIEQELGKSLSDLYWAPCLPPVQNQLPPHKKILRLLEALTRNPHKRGDSKLISEPAIIVFDGKACLTKETQRRSTLIAINTVDNTAAIRTMDKNRYQEIMQRYKSLLKYYKNEKKDLAKQYKEALPELSSVAFWESYLKLK